MRRGLDRQRHSGKKVDQLQDLLGVYIHSLKNAPGQTAAKGSNSFSGFTVGQNKRADGALVPLARCVRSP
jgi:hypothetical protein